MSNLRVMSRRSDPLQPPTVTGFVDDDGLPVPVMKERTPEEIGQAVKEHRRTRGGVKVLLTDANSRGPAGYVEDGIEEYSYGLVVMRFMRWVRG